MKHVFNVKAIQWDSPEGEEARLIRITVFVEEQKVPVEEEIDDTDIIAYHVIAYDEDGKPQGTGRLFTDPDDSALAHIGRMAVLKEARGKGCGAAIMKHLIEEARRRRFKRVILSSQTHAIPFYRKFGFIESGEEYLDCNIPHKDMVLII
jgi:predicted GNAT family N-acyltransferase